MSCSRAKFTFKMKETCRQHRQNTSAYKNLVRNPKRKKKFKEWAVRLRTETVRLRMGASAVLDDCTTLQGLFILCVRRVLSDYQQVLY
jgi:hypothetical protein